MSKFLKGTIILLIAGLITRGLGFINRIVIARFIGMEGSGLYMMAFPTLMLVISLTQLGLPVAIGKYVAEAKAVQNFKKIKQILVISLVVTTVISVIFTIGLIYGAPFISASLFNDKRVYYPLVAITPIIPIVGIAGVLKGYFQGMQNMKPMAIAQVLEQIVRICFIIFLAKLLLPHGIAYAAAGALAASIFGESASLLYMLTAFKLKKKIKIRKNFFKEVKTSKHTLKELLSVALPSTGSRLVGNFSWFLEPIVVAKSLALAGVSTAMITKQYGLVTAFAIPLLMLPSFITQSISTSLVPAISEANLKNDVKLVEYRLRQSIRFCLLPGGLSVIIIYIFAHPLMDVMYGSSVGANFVQLMAPFFLFQYIQGPLQATLQALNMAKAAMMNSIIGALLKIAMIVVLASQPKIGIAGFALAIVASTMLVTLLHWATIMKVYQLTVYIKEYIALFISISFAVAAGYTWQKYIPLNIGIVPELLGGILFVTVIYITLLIITGSINKSDLASMNVFKK